jgi:hypothetical protein
MISISYKGICGEYVFAGLQEKEARISGMDGRISSGLLAVVECQIAYLLSSTFRSERN